MEDVNATKVGFRVGEHHPLIQGVDTAAVGFGVGFISIQIQVTNTSTNAQLAEHFKNMQ